MISTSPCRKSCLMFKLNICSCSHSIISLLSLLTLSYPAWSRQLSEVLHNIIIISVYLDSKLCCKASDKYEVSSLEYLLLSIRKICCLKVDAVVLMSHFVHTSYWISKVANLVLVSRVFSCLQDQSVILTGCFISHRDIFFSFSWLSLVLI